MKIVQILFAFMLVIAIANAQDASYTIMRTSVICKQPDRYIGWPTIAQTREGELLVVFSGDRDAHVCPFGVTQLVRSRDDGKTWSEPVTINNTPLDDRDAGILQTRSGTWLVSWFTSLAFDAPRYYEKHPGWRRHADKLGPETRDHWLGSWTRRSTDGGRTWQEPVKGQVSAPHGPIELDRLLYVGTAQHTGDKFIGVEESRDDGRTWQLVNRINISAADSMHYFWEPHVVQVAGDTLLAMFRYQPRDRAEHFMRQSMSYDGGLTWTTPEKTPLWGYPPHLIQLRDGRLLVSYGHRREPYEERACVSSAAGTWEVKNIITIAAAMNDDLGYPASVQLGDGSIYTVFYQMDQPGEKTCLMGTHWKLRTQ